MTTSPPAPTKSPAAAGAVAPKAVSTVTSAGAHNAYIWLKLDYFFTWRIAADPSVQAPTVGDPTHPALRFARIASLFLAIVGIGLSLCNLVLLPLQLIAFGLVVFELLRSRGRVTAWSPHLLRACEIIVGSWMGLVATLLELLGMRVAFAGDAPTEEQLYEGALIIANHPTTADWIYLWSFMLRFGDLTRLKIMLKGTLAKVPILGWAMQCSRFLFLQRDWEKDREHMATVIEHWAGGTERVAQVKAGTAEANHVQLMMFPEGTDLRPESWDQSTAFLERPENRDLVKFQHLLQPRVTGFIHTVKLLRQTGAAKAVYDITLGSSPVPVSIVNLARGVSPSLMQFHMQRFELASLPTSDVDLARWLFARWVEKDARLETFYALEPEKRVFAQSAQQAERQAQFSTGHRLNTQFRQFSVLFLFGTALVLHFLLMCAYPIPMLILHALLIAVWITVGKQYDGFDNLARSVAIAYEQQQAQARTSASSTAIKPATSKKAD